MKENWFKIKTEYITSNISYRKLATKYNVSFMTLKTKAKNENWVEERTQTQHKINTKTTQKTVEKISDKNAYDISVEMESTSILNELICKSLKTLKRDEIFVGGKTLTEFSTALTQTNKFKRLLLDVLDADKREKLRIDREKLAIEKGKLDDPEEKTRPIVVNFDIPRGEPRPPTKVVLPNVD